MVAEREGGEFVRERLVIKRGSAPLHSLGQVAQLGACSTPNGVVDVYVFSFSLWERVFENPLFEMH